MTREDIAAQCRIIRLLDLTNLDENCDGAAIDSLCARASTRFCDVAALCVYPAWVRRASLKRPSAHIRIASVANFPDGSPDVARAVADTRKAVDEGADEIDVVLPWRALLEGDTRTAAHVLKACRAAAPPPRRMKVILETGELKSTQAIAEASRLALGEGADFLKTSTGKVPTGATLEAARTMIEVIAHRNGKAGFKASGGIRTAAQARSYLDLGSEILGEDWIAPDTFRFGASSLLDAILGEGPAPSSRGY